MPPNRPKRRTPPDGSALLRPVPAPVKDEPPAPVVEEPKPETQPESESLSDDRNCDCPCTKIPPIIALEGLVFLYHLQGYQPDQISKILRVAVDSVNKMINNTQNQMW